MSSVDGSYTGSLASFSAAATALSTASEANAQIGYPIFEVPVGYFTGGGRRSRSLTIEAWGTMTCGSTATNLTLTSRLLTSETWSAAGLLLGSTAAAAMAVSITASVWTLRQKLWLRTEGVGAASTIAALGLVHAPAGLASPFAYSMPATNTAFTVTTLDAETQYYYFLSGLVSQVTGAPTCTLQGLTMLADN